MAHIEYHPGDMCEDCGEIFIADNVTGFTLFVREGKIRALLCNSCFRERIKKQMAYAVQAIELGDGT